jgi:dTDP-4-dehydrorhamnose reductase
MAKHVVVIGSAGQLGAELVSEFTRRGYTVDGLNRATLDITDSAGTESRLAELDPEIVVNAAAYNQVDLAEWEPQAALLVNGLGVRNIAMACRQVDARFVHFSTDYVFDGMAGRPYTEEDRPHPLSAYGVSKLAGELYARAYLQNALIVRTSGVYGPGGLKNNRGNFVELMLRLANEGKPIRVVEDHVGTPTNAPLLAARTVDLVDRAACGTVHVGGGAPISWFDYAKTIFEVAGITNAQLRATNEREYRTAAHRPKYSPLDNGKMESLGLPAMPAIEEALRMYFAARNA